MIEVSIDTRMVVVLGRGRLGIDPVRCVGRAADRAVPMLILAVGYPTTEPQQRFVASAIDRAFELRVPLGAEIVADPEGLTTHLQPHDDVTIVAAGREGREIGSAVAS